MRSGSTWLLRLLCHPCRLEPADGLGFTLPPDVAAGTRLRAIPVNEFLLGHHLMPRSGDPIKVDSGHYAPSSVYSFWQSSPDYVLSHEYEEVWRPELRRFVLTRLHATVERAASRYPIADCAPVIIKDVGASHAARLTLSLLPHSRFLFLTRDGRDVVDSLFHASQPGGWFARLAGPVVANEGNRLAFLRARAREWACWSDVCAGAWAEHSPELRRKVRYEDLVADTAFELGGICEWLGIPRDPETVGAAVRLNQFGQDELTGPAEFARAAKPGLWREHFSSREREAVEAELGPQLERLGYPV
jgi:hypothetical protein